MRISIEKTPKQKLSQYAVDVACAVSVTHLPKTDFSKVVDAAIDLNQQAGSAKAILHVGARNLSSESELHENIIRAKQAGIDKVLVIGGGEREGRAYQSTNEVHHAIAAYGLEMYCGVYPQEEDYYLARETKYSVYSKGITQLCLNSAVLNTWYEKTIPGVPTNCSVEGLLKYMRMCGLTESFKYIAGNAIGIQYITMNGFSAKKFVKRLNHEQIHLYNFGRLDQTLLDLQLG